MVLDMTKGSPIGKIMRFFVPVMLGNLLQQFYSLADSFIVSRFLGVEAFAGVSATGSLHFLIIGFTWGVCSGFAIPISQEFGAGNERGLRKCFANSLYLSAVIAISMAILTAILTPQILTLIGTPADIFDYSCTYIRILFIGLPATVMYNLMAGVMRAVGDGRTPLIMLLFSTILNIILDLLMVVVFKMGIAGAAIATIVSQLVSGILCVIVIFRKFDVLKIKKDEWGISPSIMARLMGIGLPMGLQFSITAVGSTILQGAVNSLGSSAVASIGAGAKVQFIFMAPLEATGATMATYCGQNLGAGKMDRVRMGVKRITILMFIYSAAAFVMQRFAGRPLAQLFIGTAEPAIVTGTVQYLNSVIMFASLLGIVLIYRNAIQGLGHSRVAMLSGIMELIGRVFVAFVLVRFFGFSGACFANPMAWLCADALLLPLYFRIVRQEEMRIQDQGLQPAEKSCIIIVHNLAGSDFP